MANKVYEIVTNSIIAKIEEAIRTGDCLPWQKPWTADSVPVNYVTQRAYRGVNLLLLDTGEYLTWSQLCDLQKHNPELKLKKGSKAHMVVFFSFKENATEQTTQNGGKETKTTRVPFLRYYKVFRSVDVEGLVSRRIPVNFEHNPSELAEQIAADYIKREAVRLVYKNGDRACYSPMSDTVTVPEMKQYKHLAEHYSTLFHELTHSTGHPKRLNRLNTMAMFGSESYSKEELVAEIGAAMLCGSCRLDNAASVDNSTAYLTSWLKALKNDVTMIVSASAKAQKAVDLILGEVFPSENE